MEWNIDERYTVIGISSMAMTWKHEITVKGISPIDNEPYFVAKGKRKQQKFNEPIGRDMLVFKGWDIQLKIDDEQEPYDSETGFTHKVICGNACFNFMGSPEFVRSFINNNNINEHFARWDTILAHGNQVSGNDESAIPVYPEEPTTHAVVKRIREKKGMADKAPEIVSTYTRNQAIDDGILMPNPARFKCPECDIITTNLWQALDEDEQKLQAVMERAQEILDTEDFEGDNDKDFFVFHWDIHEIWCVRNENAKLTLMKSEDY